MGVLGTAAVVVSVIALGAVALGAFDLARGVPRAEARTWFAVGVVLSLAAIQRIFAAVQYASGSHPPWPIEVQITLLIGGLVIVGIALLVRPVIVRYRSAEAARRESEERFRRALSAASDPIGIIDGDGRYIYVNDAACEFTRYPREQLVGRHFRTFLADADPSSRGTLERAVEFGAAQVEREFHRGDGTTVPVQSELIALGDGTHLIIGHDLTARRDSAAARARAERLEAVSTLAAGVAHDFNNLLSIIGVSVELAIEEGAARSRLDRALVATGRAAGLTRELIDFARSAIERVNKPATATEDIRSIVRDAVEATREGLDARIRMHLELPGERVAVAAEPIDIHRVCTNLLLNARDAVLESMPAGGPIERIGGRIDVLVRMVGMGAADQSATGVEILVEDNGTGMSEDVRDRIFEPFFTTKSDTTGYGLGLAATREIVAELDGTIAVESQSGVGTTFTVWLPLAKKPPSKRQLTDTATAG